HWLYSTLLEEIKTARAEIEDLLPKMRISSTEFSFQELKEDMAEANKMLEILTGIELFSRGAMQKVLGKADEMEKIIEISIPLYMGMLGSLNDTHYNVLVANKNKALMIKAAMEIARAALVSMRRILRADMNAFQAYKKEFLKSLVVDPLFTRDRARVEKYIQDELEEIAKTGKITTLEYNQLWTMFDIYFYYDKGYGKFFVYINYPKRREIHAIYMNERLAYMMGLEYVNTDKQGWVQLEGNVRRGGFYGKYAPDIKEGVHQFYVYMPEIISDSHVGNSLVPLLRVINADKNKNTFTENIYVQEFHHRVIVKRISAIRIQLVTSEGDYLQFDWGDVIVTLHFQRSLFS
ncbi:MAG TPA: hypothetical protein VFV08_04280, partial [Puia sp.]|nr:hypothetical protein [Puia sp.]